MPKTLSGKLLTFTDADGDAVIVTLKGNGAMTVALDDPDGDGTGGIASLVLDGTDAKSTLTIKVTKGLSGDGLVRVGEIKGAQGTEAIKSIGAPGVDLIGAGLSLAGPIGGLMVHDTLNAAGLSGGGTANNKTTIVAHSIGDGTTIEFQSSLISLTAAEAGKGTIKAPAIGNIFIKGDTAKGIAGDLRSDILVSGQGLATGKSALGQLKVAGSVNDVNISAGGSIGSISIGIMSNSTVSADGPITALTAARVIQGSIVAARFGSVAIKGSRAKGIIGDFEGNLLATGQGLTAGKMALSALTVSGTIRGAEISVNGNLGSVAAGSLSNSIVSADKNLKSATVKGTPGYDASIFGSELSAFINSVITAETIGSITLASVNTDLDGYYSSYGRKSFGIVAHKSILSVSVPAMKFFWKWKATGLPDQGIFGFHVKRGGSQSSGNWGIAGVTDANGEVVLRLAGRDRSFRFADETTGLPIPGISVTITANTGTKGLGVMVVSSLYDQYPTKVLFLYGVLNGQPALARAVGAATGVSGQGLAAETSTQLFLSNQEAVIEGVEAMGDFEELGTFSQTFFKGWANLDAIRSAVRLLDRVGVPIADNLHNAGLTDPQPITVEEALQQLQEHAGERAVKDALLTGLTFAASGPGSAVALAGLVLHQAGFVSDFGTIVGCDDNHLLVSHIADTYFYTCEKPFSGPNLPPPDSVTLNIHAQTFDSTSLVSGNLQLFSCEKLGAAYPGKTDASGNVSFIVSPGCYMARVGGPGAAPIVTSATVPPGGGSLTESGGPQPTITGVSLIYDGPIPGNLAPGTHVQFHALARDANGNLSPCNNAEYTVHNPSTANVSTIDSQTGLLTIGSDWGAAYVTARCGSVSSGPVVVSGSGPVSGGGGGGGSQTWTLNSDGQSATLTVDSSGNFTGTGWMVSDPHGCSFPLGITGGRMSGSSMTFSVSGAGCGITESGSATGTLDQPFPSATSASGSMTIHITTPIGNEDLTGNWQATRN